MPRTRVGTRVCERKKGIERKRKRVRVRDSAYVC